MENLKKENGTAKLELPIAALLKALGEDPNREGLRDTPKRYARAMRFLTSGYGQDPKAVVGKAFFSESNSGLIFVRNIEFFSLCEHHLLPFFGRAHIAYRPQGKVVGLSKIPRLVNTFARRLQVQERLTREIGEALALVLNATDIAVVTEASHLCMMMRGVEKQGSFTSNSFYSGRFLNDTLLRQEFFTLLTREKTKEV